MTEKQEEGSGCWTGVGIALWITLAVAAHSVLWGGYEPPPEDMLMFIIVDSIVAAVAVAPFAFIWWLRSRRK